MSMVHPFAISNANVSDEVRGPLAVTMAVASSLVLVSTVGDFTLGGTTLTASIFSMTLLAISAVGFWATYATCVQHDSWLGASLLFQVSIAVLAGYTFLTDVRSPFPQITVGVIAGILGIIAICWVFYLVAHWRRPLTARTATIAALIPLLGFVQFWLQTDYLPRTSLPLVDVTTDLTPTGKREDIVQLDAKVTINNRGPVPVYVGATMMRITAYAKPLLAETQPTTPLSELPDAIQFGITPLRDYRDERLLIEQRETLYASELLSVADMMAAGESHTYRKVVDFDSGTMRLARLDVDGVFMTSPNIDEVYTCPVPLFKIWSHDDPYDPKSKPVPPPMSVDDKPLGDGTSFQTEISKPIYEKVDGKTVPKKFFCREIRLKPRNVIHDLALDRPSFEVLAIFNDPTNPTLPYPGLLLWPGNNGNYLLNSRQSQKVSAANPAITYKNIGAQYSPSKEPAVPGGGTPSTTQPTSTTPPPSTTQPRA